MRTIAECFRYERISEIPTDNLRIAIRPMVERMIGELGESPEAMRGAMIAFHHVTQVYLQMHKMGLNLVADPMEVIVAMATEAAIHPAVIAARDMEASRG